MGFFTHVSSKIRQTFANNDKPFATIHNTAAQNKIAKKILTSAVRILRREWRRKATSDKNIPAYDSYGTIIKSRTTPP